MKKAACSIVMLAAASGLCASAVAGPPENRLSGQTVSKAALVPEGGAVVLRGPSILATGFDSTEVPTWALGSIDNQNGWPSSGAGLPWASISAATPDAGDQHLRIILDPTMVAGTQRLVFAPAQTPVAGPSSTEVRVRISAGDTAQIDMIGQSPSEGFITWRVAFFYGDIYAVDDTGGGLAYEQTAGVYTADTYHTFRVDVSPAGDSIKYYLDNTLIYTGAAGIFAGTRTEQVLWISFNDQTGAENANFDTLSVEKGTGACCTMGVCSVTAFDACGGAYLGDFTGCAPDPCAVPGACCSNDGTCMSVLAAACMGTFLGAGVACDVGTCMGACCTGAGGSVCSVASPDGCAGMSGTFGAFNSTCSPDVFCDLTGACCQAGGVCTENLQSVCLGMGGLFMGNNTTCGTLCAQPAPVMGACCNGGTCTLVAGAGACGGTYQGDGSVCFPATGTPVNFAGVRSGNDGVSGNTPNPFLFPMGIPDGSGVNTSTGDYAYAEVDSTGAGVVGTVRVNIGLTHTYVGDLDVRMKSLLSPTLRRLVFRPDGGDEGDDLLGIYSFDDTAAQSLDTASQIPGVATVPAGVYRASEDGNVLVLLTDSYNGQAFADTWRLEVEDFYAADGGDITSLDIDITPGGANVCSAAPPGACCVGDACTVGVLQANCAGAWDAGNSCAITAGPPHSFCCPGNFDRNADKNLTDVFAGLSGYFAGVALAPAQQAVQAINWDGDGDVDLGDFFLFFADWFAACP